MPERSRRTPSPETEPTAGPSMPAPGLDPFHPGNQAILEQIAAQGTNPLMPDPRTLIAPPGEGDLTPDSDLTRILGQIPFAGEDLAKWSRDPQKYVSENWKPDDSLLKKSDEEIERLTGKSPGTKTAGYTFKF